MKTIKISDKHHNTITNITTTLIDICNYDLVQLSEGQVHEHILEIDKARWEKLEQLLPKLNEVVNEINGGTTQQRLF